MNRFVTVVAWLVACAGPALAQTHDHSAHQQPQQSAQDPHAGHHMSRGSIPNITTSADNPGRPAEEPPPDGATGGPLHAADLHFDAAAMTRARDQLRAEHGGMRAGAIVIEQLEVTFDDHEDGYAWDAQGWYGGDIQRFWWKSEGEGIFSDAVEEAEVQVLYSRAVTPYFDLQAGLRRVDTSGADRTDLVFGTQGLAPYWFEVDAAVFLSTEGELRARAEAEYDLRLTQRLILQLRTEVNLSAEDIPQLEIGAGLTSIQFGARLRYEFTRRFAPYAAVEWTGATGGTRDFVRLAGGDTDETRYIVGVRAWF